MSENNNLSRLDAWTLARICAGYEFTELPFGLTGRVENLAVQILSINFRDREALMKRNLTAKEAGTVLAMDTEAQQPAPPDDDRLWEIIHARELKNLPPLRWLIPGEIVEGGLCVLYGESGAGKSFIGLDYALTIAQERRVVYVPTEGEAGYRLRVAAWCHHHKKNEGDLYFVFGSVNLFERDVFEAFQADIQKLGPVLVVIDTLAMAMAGGDENSARDMGLVMKACRSLNRNARTSVALIHHVNKGGMIERGSGALRGAADTMIKVSPADDLVLIECAKTKDDKPFEPRYIFLLPTDVPGVGESLVPIPGEQYSRLENVLTPQQRKLLDVLSLEANREGVSTRDLESFTGISLGTVIRTLSNLLKKDYVHKPTGSYAITETGMAAIGKTDPPKATDPKVIHVNLADDSTDSTDSRDSGVIHSKHFRESRESRGSSRGKLDQFGSPVEQVPLMEVPAKPRSHYESESR